MRLALAVALLALGCAAEADTPCKDGPCRWENCDNDRQCHEDCQCWEGQCIPWSE